jgi:ATP-binding protein involved in chromosome partitioning
MNWQFVAEEDRVRGRRDPIDHSTLPPARRAGNFTGLHCSKPTTSADGGAALSEAETLFEDEATVRERIAQRLSGVERIIVVMSGKGGVGKSAVSVNLALALAQLGRSVGLLDADLNGPSVAKMLGLRGQPLRVTGAGDLGAVPGPRGLRVQSMDFFMQGSQALDWDGPAGEGASARSALEQAAIGDLLGRTEWGALDHLVIDLAPGADRLPALARWLPPVAAAVAVTIPTEVALLAVERSLRRVYDLRFPLIGIVENMGTSICGKCGAEGPLFRETSGIEIDLGSEVIARVPFDTRLAEAADAGQPFLDANADSIAAQAFAQLAERVDAYQQPGPEGESW